MTFPFPLTFMQVSGGQPLDGLTITPQAAFSCRRLFTSYTGPLLRARRTTDNAEMDFGYDADGLLDVAAIITWMGAGTAFCVTWYDQAGSGRDVTQSTTTAQPQIDTVNAYLVFDGGDYLTRAEALTLPYSVYSTLTATTATGNRVFWSAYTGGDYTLAWSKDTSGVNTTDQTGGSGIRTNATATSLVDGSPHICENINIAQNSVVTRTDGGTAGTTSGSTSSLLITGTKAIGSYAGVLFHIGMIAEVIEMPVDMTDAANLADRNLIGNASEFWGTTYSDI